MTIHFSGLWQLQEHEWRSSNFLIHKQIIEVIIKGLCEKKFAKKLFRLIMKMIYFTRTQLGKINSMLIVYRLDLRYHKTSDCKVILNFRNKIWIRKKQCILKRKLHYLSGWFSPMIWWFLLFFIPTKSFHVAHTLQLQKMVWPC